MKKIPDIKLIEIFHGIEKDPVLLSCCELLFEYANNLGLEGTRASNLRLVAMEEDEISKEKPSYFICDLETA